MITALVGYRTIETRRAKLVPTPNQLPLGTPVTDTRPYSRGFGAALLSSIDVLLASGVCIVIAEVLLSTVSVVASMVAHSVLITALLFRTTTIGPLAQQRSNRALAQHFLYQVSPVLALVSLLRILSLVIPHQEISQIYWFAMIGAPLLLGAVLAARLSGLSWRDVGFRSRRSRRGAFGAVFITATGIPLGIAAFAILPPKSALVDVDSANWFQLILAVLIIIVFVGFLEEMLFRGLLQQCASTIIGGWALPWASLIYAAMYLGSDSLEFVLFMGVVGLFFGLYFQLTRSLWGITAAHSLMSIGMLLIYPAFWG